MLLGTRTLGSRCTRARHELIIKYGYEFYKAKHVVQSRDIAYAFTNLQANDYFSFSEFYHYLQTDLTFKQI